MHIHLRVEVEREVLWWRQVRYRYERERDLRDLLVSLVRRSELSLLALV